MHTHKIVNGEQVLLTAEEIAEIETATYTSPTTPAIPTKEELLAQLQALSAQIQALE